jgi:hypothetical protein
MEDRSRVTRTIRRGTGSFQEEASLLEIYCKIVQLTKEETEKWLNIHRTGYNSETLLVFIHDIRRLWKQET